MNKKKKVTSTDVARAAGVSQATVSMVLNKKYNVSFSRETIERIVQAAKELGYQTPRRSRKADTKGEKLIVVFCPTLTNPYYVMLLQGIESIANEKGYGVFVCNTQRELRLEERYLRMMKAVHPMGIIYTFNPSPVYMEQVEMLAHSIPLAIISNREKVEVDAINQDNTKVGKLMARHLLDLGHRDVAFLATPLTKRQKQRSKRVEGFVSEFEKAGLRDHVIIRAAADAMDDIRPRADSEYQMGYELTRDLMKEHPQITAIAGLNDMMAMGIIDSLNEQRYKVPGDVSVIGCDNIFYSSLHRIALTTIDHFVQLKGRDACEIIMRKIKEEQNRSLEERPTSIYHIEYEPKLIVRRTTGYAKANRDGKKS